MLNWSYQVLPFMTRNETGEWGNSQQQKHSHQMSNKWQKHTHSYRERKREKESEKCGKIYWRRDEFIVHSAVSTALILFMYIFFRSAGFFRPHSFLPNRKADFFNKPKCKCRIQMTDYSGCVYGSVWFGNGKQYNRGNEKMNEHSFKENESDTNRVCCDGILGAQRTYIHMTDYILLMLREHGVYQMCYRIAYISKSFYSAHAHTHTASTV